MDQRSDQRIIIVAVIALMSLTFGCGQTSSKTAVDTAQPTQKSQDKLASKYFLSYQYGDIKESLGPDRNCTAAVEAIVHNMQKHAMDDLDLELLKGEIVWNTKYKIGRYNHHSHEFQIQRPISDAAGYPLKLYWIGKVRENAGFAVFDVAKGPVGKEEPVCRVVTHFTYKFVDKSSCGVAKSGSTTCTVNGMLDFPWSEE